MILTLTINIPDDKMTLIGDAFQDRYNKDGTFPGTTKQLVEKELARLVINKIKSRVKWYEKKEHNDNLVITELDIVEN